MRWFALVLAGAVVVGGTPAVAAQAAAGGITVAVADVELIGYACTTTTVTVTVDTAPLAGWTVAVVAGTAAAPRLDAVGFAGRGPATSTGSLLVCPSDGSGDWTATVDTRVVLTQNRFTVGFVVSRLPTETTISSARVKASSVRVKGAVSAGMSDRARGPLAVSGLRKGTWRKLGHTYARKDGGFRFVAPRSVTRVRVDYAGDSVTLPSRAAARAKRVSTSSSR